MNDIIGHGGGKGGSSHEHYEAQDSLHNTSYARVLDLVSEGEILGLASGLQSVYLNQTPVENADGTKNFTDIAVDFRSGTQDQDYIPGFPDIENEISIGLELKSGTPWVRAISNTSLSAVRITLGVPALSKADTSNGDILGYKIDYQIELSKDGGAYAVVVSSSFSGKTTSEYQRSARIDLPPATSGWQVRVTRLTPNAATVGVADTTTIVSYTEVIDAKLRYPMSAIVGVQVDAKQFQSIPTRAYDMFGRIIQVPSNYDPIARTYGGVWDGTFKPAWTNNPAWIFRDLVLHDRYGLGDRITASQVDKWTLYKIARYCDELVPNGKGGTEPRFTCNLYLQTRKQAYAVLQDLASIFRGISYWGAGSIFASADMPADPVYVYTAANVIGGKFTRTGSRKATRYTVALVTWNDPADFYKQKVEYVEGHPDSITRYGIQPVELTAFGCTSQAQAQRAGRWACATSYLETEGISFDVGMDGAIALPGQIVRVADPSRMGKRVGGRVRTAAGRVVTLDKAPVVSGGDKLTVILPTGVSETRTVSSVAGDSVTVDSDWTAVPVAQSVWSVDSTELSAPLFRVLSVTEKDEVTFTITAVQHEPGKFDFIENGVAITQRVQTSLDVTRQAPPSVVRLAGYTITLEADQKLALQISCPPVAGADGYEGAYRRGNDNWVAIPRQASASMDVRDVPAGSYIAKMWAFNSIGISSVETLSAPVDVNPSTAVPLVVNVGAAKAAADAANAAIQAITDDNVLARSEKPSIIQMWSAVSDEHQGIALQADGLGVSRGSYDTAFTALLSFISSISPAYTDLSQDSSVNGATMRSKFGDYYLARQTLLNAMAAKAATLSSWGGVTGPGKPQDNATVGATAGSNLKDAAGNVVGNSDFLNTYMSLGGNLCYNADFSNGLDGWTVYSPTIQMDYNYVNASHIAMAGLDWAINRGVGQGCTTFQMRQGDSDQSVAYTDFVSDPIPVVAGKRYCVSAYTGAHRCKVDVFAYLYDSNGNQVAPGYFGANLDPNDLGPSGGTNLSEYKRHQQCGTIPAGASNVRICLRKFATSPGYGYTNSWMMVGRIQLEEVGANATTAGPWNPPTAGYATYLAIANATAAITAISSDNVLSKGEKPDFMLRWNAIVAEKSDLDTQAAALGVSATNYDNAFTTLLANVNGISPAYNDLTQDSTINGSDVRTNFTNYYTEKQKLVNALAVKAATAPSVTIGGRNLLPDSGFERGLHPCSEHTALGSLSFDPLGASAPAKEGSKVLFFDRNGGGDTYVYLGGPLAPVTSGKTYTLSFYYKSSGALTGSSTYYRLSDGSHIGVNLTLGVQDKWTRSEMQWTCPAGVTTLEPRFGFICNGYAWMAVDCIKIEEGTKATTWTPAIEDVQAGIDAAATTSTWGGVSGAGKPQDGATVGAPAGTTVGSTAATTVEANAAAGAAAAGQVSSTKSVSGLYDVTGMNNQPNNTTITVVSYTVSTSGMTGPITYAWSIQKDQGTLLVLNTTSGNAVTVSAKGNNNRASGTVTCTATDSKGFTATAQAYIDVGFGSGVAA